MKIFQKTFYAITILLGLLCFVLIYALLFSHMPIDDMHYGTGKLMYVFLGAPFIGLPAFLFGMINFIVIKEKTSRLKFAFLGVSIIGFSICLIAVALANIPELYPKLNLRPHYSTQQ